MNLADPREAGPREGQYEEHRVGNFSYLKRMSADLHIRCRISGINLNYVARYRAPWPGFIIR